MAQPLNERIANLDLSGFFANGVFIISAGMLLCWVIPAIVHSSIMSNPEPTTNSPASASLDLDRARASLKQSLDRYAAAQVGEVSPSLQSDLDTLAHTLAKLEQTNYSIAVFGMVSRGKSAVLNALMGEKVLETGPLNGVTRFPRSIRWSPDGIIQIDLIDTPGLDEIDGEARGQMAAEVVRQADLILFVIAGDITQLEYQSLCELRQAQKPLLLVFNKSDLYPEIERQETPSWYPDDERQSDAGSLPAGS